MNNHKSRQKRVYISAFIIKIALFLILFSCTQPEAPVISESSQMLANLRPSHYENGLYTANTFTFSYITQDKSQWDEIAINLGSLELHFADNGISGRGTISKITRNTSDPTRAFAVTTQGLSYDGYTIADEITMTGCIDGATIYLKMISESGITGEMIMSIYDADAKINLDSGLIIEANCSSTFMKDGNGLKSGSNRNTNFIKKTAETSENPNPSAVTFKSYTPSFYEEGDYTGSLSIYLTPEDNPVPSSTHPGNTINFDDYIETNMDIEFTVSGNKITGSGTVKNTTYDLTPLPGTIMTLKGTINGSLYYITVENSETQWKTEIIGSFSNYTILTGDSSTRFNSFYGAAVPYKDYRSGEFGLNANIVN